MTSTNAQLRGSAAIISLLLHVGLIAVLLLLPSNIPPAVPLGTRPIQIELEQIEPTEPESLLFPPKNVTQPFEQARGNALLASPSLPLEPDSTLAPSAQTVVTPETRVDELDAFQVALPLVETSSGHDRETDSGAGSRGEGGGGNGGNTHGDSSFAVPDWIVKPTPEQQAAALSTIVMKAGVSGGAILSCLVTRQNRVRNCKVLKETAGSYSFGQSYEFGRAALRLSRTFRVRPPVRDGIPRYDIPVRIPVYWAAQ